MSKHVLTTWEAKRWVSLLLTVILTVSPLTAYAGGVSRIDPDVTRRQELLEGPEEDDDPAGPDGSEDTGEYGGDADRKDENQDTDETSAGTEAADENKADEDKAGEETSDEDEADVDEDPDTDSPEENPDAEDLPIPLMLDMFSEGVYSVSTESELETALRAGGEEVFVELNEDITLSKALSLPAGKAVTIRSAFGAGERTITAAAGRRHFDLSMTGEKTYLTLDRIVLDGGGNGGGISVTNGSFFLEGSQNSIIQNCSAGVGGAIIYNQGDSRVSNITLDGNAAAGNGGAISVARTSLTLENVNITNNTAVNGGGVYYNAVSTSLIIDSNSLIDSNTASGNGGGIYLGEGRFTMDGSTVSNNTADGLGGGIMNYTNVIRITNSKLDGNSAREGGALYNNAMISVTIEDSEISNNSAETYGGGIGVYYMYYTMLLPYIHTNRVTFAGNETKNEQYVSGISTAVLSTHDSYIKDSSFSAFAEGKRFDHAYNNYDITNGAATYRLFYEWMGAEGGPVDENKYMSGAAAVLNFGDAGFGREGYEFKGWARNYTATVPDYVTAELLEITGNITLYAVWEKKAYTVTFDVNGINSDYEAKFSALEIGASMDWPEGMVEHNTSIDLSKMTAPTQFGYKFKGWATLDGGRDKEVSGLDYLYDADGSYGPAWGTVYGPSDSYRVTEDTVLYAVWEKDDFKIPAMKLGSDGNVVVTDRNPENKLRVALSSQREEISICLIGDVYLTESMKADQLRHSGIMKVRIYGDGGTPKKIIQTATARHFHLRNDGTTAELTLENIILTTSRGYGGIEIAKGTLSLDGTGTSAIVGTGDGKGYAYGGGIWVYDGGSLELSDITIEGSGVPNVGRGGGIAVEGAKEVTLNDVTIRNNQAAEGGGLYVSNLVHGSGASGIAAKVKITGGSIDGNSAVFKDNGQGNALALSLSNGGGIALHNYGSGNFAAIEGSGLRIADNITDGNGGGVFVNDEKHLENVTLSRVDFEGNKAQAERYVTVVSKEDETAIDRAFPDANTLSCYGEGNTPFSHAYNNYDVAFLKEIHTVTYDDGESDASGNDPVVDPERYGSGAGVEMKEIPASWEKSDYELHIGSESKAYWSDEPDAGYYYAMGPGGSGAEPSLFQESSLIKIDRDYVLYPVFVPETCMITFDANGGRFAGSSETAKEVYVLKGEKVPAVSDPEYPDDTLFFSQWTDDAGNPYDFVNGAVTADITFKAQWVPVLDGDLLIHFNANGGTPVPSLYIDNFDPNNIDYTGWPVDSQMEKESGSYSFEGWYTVDGTTDNQWGTKVGPGEDALPAGIAAGKEYTVHAKWNPLISYGVVSGDGVVSINDGTGSDTGQVEVGYGDTVTVEAKNSGNHKFSKWVIREGNVLDRKIYDSYQARHLIEAADTTYSFSAYFAQDLSKVSFYDEHDAPLFEIDVNRGAEIPSIYFDPGQVPGHKEIIWYQTKDRLDQEKWEPSTPVASEQLDLYLKLIPDTYTVTFELNGGTWTEAGETGRREVFYRETVAPPAEPVRNYYDFSSWVLQDTNNYFDPDGTLIESDLVLEAKWTPLPAPAPLVTINEGDPEMTVQVGRKAKVKTDVFFDTADAGNQVELVEWYLTNEQGTVLSLRIAEDSSDEKMPGVYSFDYTPNSEDIYYLIAKAYGRNDGYEPGKNSSTAFSEVLKVKVVEETFTVTATAGPGGTITPSGDVQVEKGDSKEFRITPDSRYRTSEVIIDGQPVDTIQTSYTFTDVGADHTIAVNFERTGGSGGGSGSKTEPDQDAANPDAEEIEVEEEDVLLKLEMEDHPAYLHGYQDGTVRPDADIKRAEVASIFYLLVADENKEEPVYDAEFTDISRNDWYFQQVAYLQKYKIVTGYLDGRFDPENSITRAEFVTIASRFVRLREGDAGFADIDEEHWAARYIANAYNRGWITGYDDGTFRPDRNITRAEAVTIINKMLDRKVETEDIPADLNRYPDLTPAHWAYRQILEASVEHEYERKSNGYELWTSYNRNGKTQ